MKKVRRRLPADFFAQRRSLYLHFEDAVYLCDTAANAQIEEDFVQTFPQCCAITYEQCRHVHLYQRILRALLRMFAPLM